MEDHNLFFLTFQPLNCFIQIIKSPLLYLRRLEAFPSAVDVFSLKYVTNKKEANIIFIG